MGDTSKSDREIFNAAMDIIKVEERAAFLDRECAGDVDLRRRVEVLLDALESAGGFMETGIGDAAEAQPKPEPSTRVVERPKEGPGTVIGNYKLLQEIGEGGFGVVYMAEQTKPSKRKVALKVIKPGMDTREIVARFEAERQALALLVGALGMTLLYLRASADRTTNVTAWHTAERQTEVAQAEKTRAEQAQAAEGEQRRLAQRNAEQIKQVLARADLLSGVEMLGQHQDRRALTHLARSLRTDGSLLPAAQVLVSALRDRNFDLGPEIILRHDSPITSFWLNESSEFLLTRAEDGSARLWDAASWELLKEFGGESPLISARFSPTGGHLLTLAQDGVVRVWDLRTRQTTGEPIVPAGGAAKIKAVASPEGRLILATRSTEGSLQVWDVQTGQLVSGPFGHEDSVDFFDLTQDGRTIISRCAGRIYFWPMPSADPAIPGWLPDLAEAVAGRRLDDRGNVESIPPARLQELRSELSRLEGTDDYSRFARWFVADRADRPNSPDSTGAGGNLDPE